MNLNKIPAKYTYLPKNFTAGSWKEIKPEFDRLFELEINSAKELVEFWERVSELERTIEDQEAELYITMTQQADRKEHQRAYLKFQKEIGANVQKCDFQLKQKFYASPFREKLPKQYHLLNQIIANSIEIFREENIPLSIKEQELIAKYDETTSKMTVRFQGKKRTIPEMTVFLEEKDRATREKAWRLMYKRFRQDEQKLDQLFDQLRPIRHQMALNAGFKNYRDYMHAAKGRFSYSPQDLLDFHKAIEKVVVPAVAKLNDERRKKLGISTLKPWDFAVQMNGGALAPFSKTEELIEKSIRIMNAIDPKFGQELREMRANGFLDLENRKGKAGGGYYYPINRMGSGFIFMNAVKTQDDVETMMHEGGHAMHGMMAKEQKIIQYTQEPSEVTEVASMSMELISSEKWNIFYPDETELRRAQKDKVIEGLKFLPYGTIVDAFQHWIYTHPKHTADERKKYFSKLIDRYKVGGDWSGLEKERAMSWMMKLHIFKLPFYYIEYVISQLAAFAIYRNFLKDPKKTIASYKKFLSVGYSRPVPEVYKSGGIKFDLSEKYIAQIVNFAINEIGKR